MLKPLPNLFSPARQAAMRALYGPHVPMGDDDIAAFESAKAAVQAADELRRNPSPQVDLLDPAA